MGNYSNQCSRLRSLKIENIINLLGNFNDKIQITEFDYCKDKDLYEVTVYDDEELTFKFYEYKSNSYDNCLSKLRVYDKNKHRLLVYNFNKLPLNYNEESEFLTNGFYLETVTYFLKKNLTIKYNLGNGNVTIKNNAIQYSINVLSVDEMIYEIDNINYAISNLEYISLENILNSINLGLSNIYVKDFSNRVSQLSFKNGKISNFGVMDSDDNCDVDIDKVANIIMSTINIDYGKQKKLEF